VNESDLAETVEALRESIADLEKRNADLALKTQIVTSQLIGKTGLDRFFGEREFWDNIYDSGMADCAKRCIDQAAEDRRECAKITDPAKRLACYEEASSRAAKCQQNCSESFG
jgi:hypothetical protein